MVLDLQPAEPDTLTPWGQGAGVNKGGKEIQAAGVSEKKRFDPLTSSFNKRPLNGPWEQALRSFSAKAGSALTLGVSLAAVCSRTVNTSAGKTSAQWSPDAQC